MPGEEVEEIYQASFNYTFNNNPLQPVSVYLAVTPSGNQAFVSAYTATPHIMAIPADPDGVPETWTDMLCFAHTQAQQLADKFQLVASIGQLKVGLFHFFSLL